MRLFVSLLLLTTPAGFTILFLYLVVDPIVTPLGLSERTAGKIIERIPTEPAFYVAIAVIVGLRMWWRWRRSFKLEQATGRTMRADHTHQLKPRDWWLIRDLRERALALRARADLIFAGGFLALMAGIYAITFILPDIAVRDRARLGLGLFQSQFGQELGCVVEGRCAVRLEAESIRHIVPEENFRSSRESLEGITRQGLDIKVSYDAAISKVNLHNYDIEPDHIYELPHGERSELMASSLHGIFALISGNDGMVWMTKNHGKDWTRWPLELKPREYIKDIVVGTTGAFGTIIGDEGSVWITRDLGETWKKFSLTLPKNEYVSSVTIGDEGGFGIVAGNDGSVWTTLDQGESWKRANLKLQEGEDVSAMAVAGRLEFGIVGGDEGSVWITPDRGRSWHKKALELLVGEGISDAAVGDGGRFGIVAGDRGSVWISRDGGRTWDMPTLKLREDEEVIAMAFSDTGGGGILASDDGSLWMTRDYGATWKEAALEMPGGERPNALAISGAGRYAIVAGDEGSVWGTREYGDTWRRLVLEGAPGTRIMGIGLGGQGANAVLLRLTPYLTTVVGTSAERHKVAELRFGDQLKGSAASRDGEIAIAGVRRGDIWMITEQGQSVTPLELELRPTEWLEASAFSADGMLGIAAGDEGSVWVTEDKGSEWKIVSISLEDRERVSGAEIYERAVDKIDDGGSKVSSGGWGTKLGVITTTNRKTFVVTDYPQLAGWGDWSLAKVQDELRSDSVLSETDLFRRVNDYILSTRSTLQDEGGDTGDGKLFGGFLDNLTIVRVSSLAVMFFFVQMLIRLYQYNLRLAAFWDSRADAILVAEKFVGHKVVGFDGLVQAMAPDAYDFKPPPRSPGDWIGPRRRGR